MRRKTTNGAELPQPLPDFTAGPDELAAWVSKALPQPVASTWRGSPSERAGLVVRFASGRELVFETIAEACRPERFGAAVIAATGWPMPAYSKGQLQILVAALVRMAKLASEADDRDFWADTGATFLRACLTVGNVQEIQLDADCEDARLELYRAAVRYSQHLGTLADDEFPRVLLAADRATLLIPRGPFLGFAQRRSRNAGPGWVHMQMQRVEWRLCDLRPRKPGARRAGLSAAAFAVLGDPERVARAGRRRRQLGPWVPRRSAKHARARPRARDRGKGSQRDPRLSRAKRPRYGMTFSVMHWVAVVSTSYCLSGTMADGSPVRAGSVASNQYPLGTRLEVRPAPYRRRWWTVRDRIGWGTDLDFWLPSCGSSIQWGRRDVHLRRWHRPRPRPRARVPRKGIVGK